MKFVGLRDNIVSSVIIASRFSQPRGNLPILSNIYLQIKKSCLIIKSTNLESGSIIEIRGIGDQEGDFTINAKLLSDYLINIPDEKIELEVKDDKLYINTDKYQSFMNGIEATDFPVIPEKIEGEVFEIESAKFKNYLNKTIFATSSQELRQELSGVLFNFKNNNLTIAVTDSFRLAEQKIQLAENNINNCEIIIPHKTLQEILKICDQTKEKNTKITFNNNEIMFEIGNIKIFSRLIEGQYPDYHAIVPQQINTTAEMETKILLQTIKTASLFSQNGLFDVNLKFDVTNKQIKVFSHRTDVGENNAKVDCLITGEDVELIINYRYLLDFLSKIPDEKIEFLITTSNQPIKIRPKNDENYFYLIMPIRQ